MKIWLRLKHTFESVQPRERGLFLGVALAVLYLAWEFVLYQPLEKNQKILATKEKVLTQDITTLTARKQVLERLTNTDPNAALKTELNDLELKIQTLDKKLDELAVGLISADRLPEMLHDVLKQSEKLKIIKLFTLPIEEVQYGDEVKVSQTQSGGAQSDGAQADTSPKPTSDTPSQDDPTQRNANIKLYRHGVRVMFAGNFTQTMSVLGKLEKSGWQFYWDTLEYDVKQYPLAHVSVHVFTLSTDRGVFDG